MATLKPSPLRAHERLPQPATCDEQRVSQIIEWTTNLQGAIDVLDKALARHLERLQPVLREELSKASALAPEAMLVPLANQLRSYSNRLVELASALTSATERVEL